MTAEQQDPSNQPTFNQGGPATSLVMKFGGSSVEDAAAIRRVSQLVKRRLRFRPVIVVSALSGVTDQLLGAARAAAGGGVAAAKAVVESVRQRHLKIATELVDREAFDDLWNPLEAEFALMGRLLDGIAAEAVLTSRAQDHLLGIGEILSSRIVGAAMNGTGLDTFWVDAKTCIITDAVHTWATPLWEETNSRLRATILPILESGRVPVLGGFMASTLDGVPTTLGRGGSDFTASIVGAGLQSTRIEIWTDVDGIMTTDPQMCPDARRVERMSFDEAADLSYFGAKVLHPATLLPAMRKDVPVWVLNSRNPECAGTQILARTTQPGGVKAITLKRGIAVVDVEPVRWMAPELLREVCEVFERNQHSLDLLSASRGSLSLLVSSTTGMAEIAEELRGMATVRWENHKALVCLVGEKIRRRADVASQVFSAMAEFDMRMICQGASERNISFLVDESVAEESVRRLHKLFFPDLSAQTGNVIVTMTKG